MQFVYIHGFNSGVPSRSGKALSALVGSEVFCPQCDYSLEYASCLDGIVEQIKAAAEGPYCIMGTSLGGFYALQLRFTGILNVIAWNPVIFPALQLARLTGRNKRFTDGKDWDFPENSLLSYAQAPDPRMWKNFYWKSLEKPENQTPFRTVVLGDADEVLDSRLANAFWTGHAELMSVHAGHRIENYGHILKILNNTMSGSD